MTVRKEYIIIGILTVILLWVAYSTHVTNRRLDANDAKIEANQDSIKSIQEQRMGQYMELVRLQLSVDSLRTKKSSVIIKYAVEKGIINSASADSLGLIIRSDID